MADYRNVQEIFGVVIAYCHRSRVPLVRPHNYPRLSIPAPGSTRITPLVVGTASVKPTIRLCKSACVSHQVRPGSMSPSQKHQSQSSSHGRKVLPAHARASKPPPLKRGSSYNNAHGQGQSSSRLSPVGSKRFSREVPVSQDHEADETASFLQFWYAQA